MRFYFHYKYRTKRKIQEYKKNNSMALSHPVFTCFILLQINRGLFFSNFRLLSLDAQEYQNTANYDKHFKLHLYFEK